jgi:uncharacterized protein (TIGR02611 family)
VVIRHVRRGVVTLVGAAIVVLGVLLIVLPGPGFLTIVAGLAVLATEYDWARRALDRAKDRALRAAEQATRHWWSSAVTVATGLGMFALGVALIVIEALPLSGAFTGASVIVAAVALLATAVYAIRTPGYGSHPPDREPIDLG